MKTNKKSDNREHFISPDSSNVHSAHYDAGKSTLFIYFTSKAGAPANCCYRYDGVDKEFWQRFKRAESKGKFVLAEVKGKLKGVRL